MVIYGFMVMNGDEWWWTVMWVKQCHKPPMTGNSLYHLCMVMTGRWFISVFPTLVNMLKSLPTSIQNHKKKKHQIWEKKQKSRASRNCSAISMGKKYEDPRVEMKSHCPGFDALCGGQRCLRARNPGESQDRGMADTLRYPASRS